MARNQFKEQGEKILAHMKECDCVDVGDPAACSTRLGLTPFELNGGLKYLLDHGLIIAVGDRSTRISRTVTVHHGVRYAVNPNPTSHQTPRRPQKTARVRVPRSPTNPTVPVQQQEPASRGAVQPPPQRMSIAPIVATDRPHIDIDASIQQYVMAALAAIRATVTLGVDGWQTLKIVSLNRFVHQALTDISREQAARLVSILCKLKLVIVNDSCGCSHVRGQPEVVTTAMLRHVGCNIEPTTDELEEELAAAHRQIAALRADLAAREKTPTATSLHWTSQLEPNVAARAQYYVLSAMRAK